MMLVPLLEPIRGVFSEWTAGWAGGGAAVWRRSQLNDSLRSISTVRYLLELQEVNMAQAKRLQAGDAAPDFTLPAPDGKMVSLSDFRGRSEVVLFFYPKDNTPGCTREACSFRDSYEALYEAGAEVIGISSDSTESHQQFGERFRLPFLLLSDHDDAVRARYGVAKTLGILPGRATFLIDRHGIIRFVFTSQFQPTQHVAEAPASSRSCVKRRSATGRGLASVASLGLQEP